MPGRGWWTTSMIPSVPLTASLSRSRQSSPTSATTPSSTSVPTAGQGQGRDEPGGARRQRLAAGTAPPVRDRRRVGEADQVRLAGVRDARARDRRAAQVELGESARKVLTHAISSPVLRATARSSVLGCAGRRPSWGTSSGCPPPARTTCSASTRDRGRTPSSWARAACSSGGWCPEVARTTVWSVPGLTASPAPAGPGPAPRRRPTGHRSRGRRRGCAARTRSAPWRSRSASRPGPR